MGMFDSVIFACPNCGGEVEAQSKSGDCILARYSPQHVPKDVAEGISRDAHCGKCNQSFRVREHDPNDVELYLD